jgi:intracellular septation protein
MNTPISHHSLIHYFKIITKSLFEFLPILSFFLFYELTDKNFFSATFVMMLMTILYTFYTFHKEKRIPYLALFICLETTIFGSLTLVLKDAVYVQMRDTFYDLILGSLILVTAYFRNPIIKKFFGHIFDLDIETWISLSYKWAGFLLTFGISNEIIRKNFSEEVWVYYKFCVFAVTITFGLYLFWRYRKEVKSTDII